MKLIILDRDGVINHDSPDFIKSPAEWIPIPGSLEAIARLNQAGYRVVLATNQSGIARGLFDIATLNAIHAKMHAAAQLVGADIDAIFFCPHAALDACDCRKPKSGMFEEIGKRFKIRQGRAHADDRRPAARHQGLPGPGRDGQRPAQAHQRHWCWRCPGVIINTPPR